MKKRGQAQIITVVLIILLVLASIVIVWNVVRRVVTSSTEGASTEALMVDLAVKEVQANTGGGIDVKVSRSVGKGELTELKFILEDDTGNSYTESVTSNLPDELGTRTYSLFSSLGAVDARKISVVPVVGEKIGIPANKNIDMIVLSKGLVSWWKFDGDFTDSAEDNYGVPMGDAQIVNGELILDGSGNWVDAGNGASLNIVGAITLGAWVKSSDTRSLGRIIAKGTYGGSQLGYSLQLYPGSGGKVSFIISTGSEAVITSNAFITDDTWKHLVGTRDADGLMYLYVNTVRQTETTTKTGSMSNIYPLAIGVSNTDALQEYFNGTIDNIMIFNKSLSQQEIQNIYNSQRK